MPPGVMHRLRWLARLFETGRALGTKLGELTEDVAGRRFDLLEPYLPPDLRLEDSIDDALARVALLCQLEEALWALRDTWGDRRFDLHDARCAAPHPARARAPRWLTALDRRARRLTAASGELVDRMADARYERLAGKG